MTYEHLDWSIDYAKLRVYLKEKYSVSTAYYFIGNVPHLSFRYIELQRMGYVVMLRESILFPNGRMKANCDVELTLQTMIDKPTYDKAVILTSDGDFACLVKHLMGCGKLERVLAPCLIGCSSLLCKAAGTKIDFLDNTRCRLEDKEAKKDTRKMSGYMKRGTP